MRVLISSVAHLAEAALFWRGNLYTRLQHERKGLDHV